MNTPTQTCGQRHREAPFAQLGRYMNGLYRYPFFEPEENLKVEDVMPELDLSTPEEIAVVEPARAYLKQKLVEAGCAIRPGNDRAPNAASAR